VGRLRPAVWTLAGVLGFVAVAAGYSGVLAPGSAETDRIAEVVSSAVSYPRQESAAGYARAALATRAGQDGRLRVVAIEERKADELTDPLGRLVFLVHLEVRAALVEALGKAAADAATGPSHLLPAPQVATDGPDIGVALAAPDDHSCLLGARTDGKVLVWRPSRVQLQPGELTCGPGTALARQGTRPPH
jgi:hypothetical protein